MSRIAAFTLLLLSSLVLQREELDAGDFRRGDANDDGTVDVSDGVFILLHLFGGATTPPCEKAADIDDSSTVDLSDPIAVFAFLFLGGEAPLPPGPDVCGPDPTADGLSCLAATGCEQPATRMVRGPYLQSGTSTSIVVKWRTEPAATGEVRYGVNRNRLTGSVAETSPTTDHEIALWGLSPDTLYYYSVGTTAEPLATDDQFFRTAPIPGTAKPTRVWVLGDSGAANSSVRAVRDAYKGFTGDIRTDLWIMLGDNAYEDGLDWEYQEAVFEVFPSMLRKSVLWATLGNHDNADSDNQTGPYYDVFTFPTNGEAGGVPSGTEAYYSFDYGNVHFVSLDSEETDRSSDAPMATWLREDLALTDRHWTIVFFHNPPYSKGNHDSDAQTDLTEMRENFVPIMDDAGVDMVLAAHSHNYERSYLLDGHYETSDTLEEGMLKDKGDGRREGDGAYAKSLGPHHGTVYVVCGSSSRVTQNGTLDHPVMFRSLRMRGSLVLDINDEWLDVRFLDRDGVVQDACTIVKRHP